MKKEDIIRAWKDEDYYLGLSEAERQALPANPAGLVDLRDADLREAAGGTQSTIEACGNSAPPSACRSVWYCTETTQGNPECPCG